MTVTVHTAMAPSHISAGAIYLETAAIPKIARRVYLVSATRDGCPIFQPRGLTGFMAVKNSQGCREANFLTNCNKHHGCHPHIPSRQLHSEHHLGFWRLRH